jgi:hypothetical protein
VPCARQVAKAFGREHGLSPEAMGLLESTLRTHMTQVLKQGLTPAP